MIHRMNLAALFFMAVLLLTGCTNKEKTDFSKYITGYTSGVIKSSSSLSVYLGQPSDKGFQAGSTLPADLFRISPAIKGELILKDNHSIEFIPAERFKTVRHTKSRSIWEHFVTSPSLMRNSTLNSILSRWLRFSNPVF